MVTGEGLGLGEYRALGVQDFDTNVSVLRIDVEKQLEVPSGRDQMRQPIELESPCVLHIGRRLIGKCRTRRSAHHPHHHKISHSNALLV